jgi:hypothetical protein
MWSLPNVTPELKRKRPARPLPASCAASSASSASSIEPPRRSSKLSDGLGDSGLSDAEQSRGAGERAGFNDADEHFHRGQAIHDHSSKECMLSLEAASAIRTEWTV